MTAYEIRISYVSADVCSYDLLCGLVETDDCRRAGDIRRNRLVTLCLLAVDPGPHRRRLVHSGPDHLSRSREPRRVSVRRVDRSANRHAVAGKASLAPHDAGSDGCILRERHTRSEEHTSELQSLMRITYA